MKAYQVTLCCYFFVYVQQNYKESAVYLARFKQYLSRALSMIKQNVVNTLKTATNDVRPKQVN